MFERQVQFVAAKFLEPFTNVQRLYLAVTSCGCVALFLIAARVMHWPAYLRLEDSLLASANPVAGVAALAVGMGAAVVIGSLLLGRLRYEASLFVACVGLAALAARGGTVGALLRSVGKSQVYLTLLMETVMLLGLFGLAWQLLGLLSRQGWVLVEPPLGEHELPGTILQKFMATLLQALVTGLLILLLAQSDNKKQVLAAVFVASMLASLVAHQAIPSRPSAAFWVGPFLTAMVGYAWAIHAPGQWMIGAPANAIVMASPLDYASLGTAGAIYGYWTSRVWRETAPNIELPDEI